MVAPRLICLVAALIIGCCGNSNIKRDPSARAAFMKAYPGPANGHTHGACPGYVVDHIVPLKRGGGDNLYNMQWQTVEDGKAKDKWE